MALDASAAAASRSDPFDEAARSMSMAEGAVWALPKAARPARPLRPLVALFDEDEVVVVVLVVVASFAFAPPLRVRFIFSLPGE